MVQVYFLSIFLNVVAGYVLISDDDKEALEIRPGLSLKDETVRMVLGILSMVTGLLKLLSPTQGDLLILGDLVPAVAGFAAGFILLIEYYQKKTTIDTESVEKSSPLAILTGNRKIVGYVAIAVAAVHFLFPRILFL